MKYIISYSILIVIGASLFFGCAEQRYDLTAPQDVSVHAEGVLQKSSNNFHGELVRSNNWELFSCTQCHGSDYAGGKVFATCLTCHSNDNGPEACNTCHGDFSDLSNIAPPQGTNNEILTTDAAVGAHQVHLYGIQIAQNVACSECHAVPSQLATAGHIDETDRAEVIFNNNYELFGDSTAVYNFESITCENSYCHGNFSYASGSGVPIEGNYFAPKWNQVDGSQARCGTCHGSFDEDGDLVTPLPTGHPGSWVITDCWNCHKKVVDNQGNIIDPALHINGERNIDF